MWSIDWGIHNSLMVSFSGLGIQMRLTIKYYLFIDYEYPSNNHSFVLFDFPTKCIHHSFSFSSWKNPPSIS